MKKLLNTFFALAAVGALGFAGYVSQVTAEAPHPEFSAKPACRAPKISVETVEVNAPVYEIAEPDLLQLFMQRVGEMKASGEYRRRFDQNKEAVRSRFQNPPAVAGLKRSEEMRRWALKPEIPEGLPERLLAESREMPAGKFSRPLVFVPAETEEDLQLIRLIPRLVPEARIVLTAGEIASASKASGTRIFFDQGGALVRRFEIKAVPAAVFNGERGPEGIEFSPGELSLVAPLMHSDS